MKKNRVLIAGLLIATIVFGTVIGLYWANSSSVKNKLNNYERKVFDRGTVTFEDCGFVDGCFVSESENAAIVIDGLNSYVNNLYLDASLANPDDTTYVTMSYAGNGQDFTDENSRRVPVIREGSRLYISVGETVDRIRLTVSNGELFSQKTKDPLDRSDMLFSDFVSILTNPRHIDINVTHIFASISVLLVVSLVVIVLVLYRRRFDAAKAVFDKYKYLLVNMLSKDIKVKYRRSALGILWSVLNPLLMMLVISAVLSKLLRGSIQNFPAFYLSGYVLFNYVSEATSMSLSSIIDSSSLMKKVYVPKYIFPVEKTLFALVNMLFSLIAVLIVFLILGIRLTWTALLFPLPILYATGFALGFSFFLSAVNVFFRDVGHLYSVWVTEWMYFTPIIYPVSILPDIMKTIIKFNPMLYYVEYFRDILLYGRLPSLEQNLVCIGFAAIFLGFGLFVFKKNQDKFILYV